MVKVAEFSMQVPIGWNGLTFYESAGQEFSEQFPDIEFEHWIIYVNEEEMSDDHDIQPVDKIHMVIQDWFLGWFMVWFQSNSFLNPNFLNPKS